MSKIVPRSETPRRPTTGQLGPKKAPDVHMFNGVEILDCLPLDKDWGMFKISMITKSGDVSSAKYTNSYMLSTLTIMKNHKIISGGFDCGKVFQPPLTSDEWKVMQESLESARSPKMVQQTCDPLSISGPPGQFEDEGHANKSDMERLLGAVATLRNNNKALEERVAELRMANFDLEDNFRALRISINAKIKRIAKAMGREALSTVTMSFTWPSQ